MSDEILSLEDEIFLNQIAQGVHSASKGVQWFQVQSTRRRGTILRGLGHMLLQAGANNDDLLHSVSSSGAKSTLTPCVFFKKSMRPKEIVAKVVNLPENEQKTTFLLLILAFSSADNRRRKESCSASCRHWWHKDLSRPEILDEIRQSNSGRANND